MCWVLISFISSIFSFCFGNENEHSSSWGQPSRRYESYDSSKEIKKNYRTSKGGWD